METTYDWKRTMDELYSLTTEDGYPKSSLECFFLANRDIFQLTTSGCQHRLSKTCRCLYYCVWTYGIPAFVFNRKSAPFQAPLEIEQNMLHYLSRKPNILSLDYRYYIGTWENTYDVLTTLQSLQTIILPVSGVQDLVLASLVHLTTLTSITVPSCNINPNIALRMASGFPKLNHFDVRNMALNEEILGHLANHQHLTTLRVISNPSSQRGIKRLSSLTKLVDFAFGRELSKAALNVVYSLTQLRVLSLAETVLVQPTNLEGLKRMTALESLNFCGCEWFTIQHLHPLINLERLTSLKVGATSIGNEGLVLLGTFTRLKSLQIPSHNGSNWMLQSLQLTWFHQC